MKSKRYPFIEMIGTGRRTRREFRLWNIRLIFEPYGDQLCIASVNRRLTAKQLHRGAVIPFLQLLYGYNQEGIFEAKRPHKFRECQHVTIRKRKGRIVSVEAVHK